LLMKDVKVWRVEAYISHQFSTFQLFRFSNEAEIAHR
jgi:hypothetical protein